MRRTWLTLYRLDAQPCPLDPAGCQFGRDRAILAAMSSETGPLLSVLLKHPREAWGDAGTVRRQWRALNYAGEPDLGRALEEYDAFVAILRESVPDVRLLPPDSRTGLDSIYIRDAAVATERGLVLCRMGKPERRGEPEALGDFCRAEGLPILGAIDAPGTLEGGDVLWLDARLLAVGRGYRTNVEGIRQLREILAGLGVEVVEVPLPHWKGPGDVMHLMSLLSPVAPRTVLAYSRLLPVPAREWLIDLGVRLLEVAEAEFPTMGGNVLALDAGRCLALDGNPLTRKILESAGLDVVTYRGLEISAKGAGGPTCLTRPLRRR